MSSIARNTVQQQHSGPGDNVAGNKIINQYQSIAPDALQKPIELILSAIRSKNPDLAKDRLEIIKTTATLDTSSEIILDGLSLHLNLLGDKEKTKLFSSLITFLKTSHDDLTSDLCLATLIRLEAESGRIDDARDRYLQTSQPGPYSQEVFYELVATTDELELAYNKNKINLGESEFNGLVRGFFRKENHLLALKVAKRLNDVFPSFNSRVLVLLAKGVTLLNGKLQETYFWTITATLKAELIEFIDEIVSMINESSGQDNRLFNVALPSLLYLHGEHKELRDICWKYVDKFQESFPDAAARLHSFYTEDSSKINDSFVHDYVKAKQDNEYREKLLNELTSSTEIPIDKFLILKDVERNRIIQWGKSGGVVICENALEADFRNLQLTLITLTNKNNRVELEGLRDQVEKFINTHQEKLPTLNPIILIELAESLLLYPDLSLIVCNLIKPLLPTTDLWASPIVKCYLNALLSSEQTATLAGVLKDIRESEWDSELWIIQGNMLEHLADYPQAIQSIEKSLELDRYSLTGWYCLVRLHRKLEDTDEAVRSILKRIPDKVLSSGSDVALTLMVEIAKTGDFNRAERIMLSCFVKSPDACATAFSNFHFNLTIGKCNDLTGSERVGDCIVGVVYIEDNVQMTKLLIDNQTPKHHCLLDINSPLGVFLNNMEVGEIKQYGMHDYKLIERLPAYVAAFRISLELRKIQNDGNDCFYAFQVPNDPDEMLVVFEEKLSRIQRNKDNNIINNPDIPLLFKGYFLYRNDPIKAALTLWSTKNSAKYQLPNFGKSLPTKAILDVYTIAYLALTGLAFGIKKIPVSFLITQETKYFIEEWLREINSEDYFSVGVRPGGGLWRVTAEDIKQSNQHRQIQDALSLIIAECDVVTPVLVDMPPLILRIHDLVDDSVYSSIKLSISNDIPWLCLDGILAHLFQNSGWKSVNALELFIELSNALDFEMKKEGLYLHALEYIPYALTFHDLSLLSTTNDEHAHYFLAKLIHLYPKAFTDTNIAVETLSSLLIPVLGKAYLEGEILRGLRLHNPRNNGYAERVFNACCCVSMQSNDGVQAELALAMLLCKLFTIFSAIPPMLKLICTMATVFANGHFLAIPLIKQHISNLEID